MIPAILSSEILCKFLRVDVKENNVFIKLDDDFYSGEGELINEK